MRRIRFMSDLHLEFGSVDMPIMEGESEDILVLAGDVGLATRPESFAPFIFEMAERFHTVIWVMGNHEHYDGNIESTHELIRAEIPNITNVFLADNTVIKIDNMNFICATLWASFDFGDYMVMNMANLHMKDHRLIKITDPRLGHEDKLRPKHTFTMHNDARRFIFEAAEASRREFAKNRIDGRTIIVTHHGPSFQSITPSITNSFLNGAYVTDLESDIKREEPHLWIHGHTHVSREYKIGKTVIKCNPRGYFAQNLNSDFDPCAIHSFGD